MPRSTVLQSVGQTESEHVHVRQQSADIQQLCLLKAVHVELKPASWHHNSTNVLLENYPERRCLRKDDDMRRLRTLQEAGRCQPRRFGGMALTAVRDAFPPA